MSAYAVILTVLRTQKDELDYQECLELVGRLEEIALSKAKKQFAAHSKTHNNTKITVYSKKGVISDE